MFHQRGFNSILMIIGSWLAAMSLAGCEDARFVVRQPPGSRTDIFTQTAVPTIDILWVVDNSKSMAEEQEALGENFSGFYDYLNNTGADFQIGIISTDVYNPDHRGQLLSPVITRATPNTAETFATNIRVGIEGKGDEQGFYAAELALSEPLISTVNKEFLRQDAYLFIIFVSDEDDRSFGEVSYFMRRFEQIKGIGNDGMVNIAAIVELEAGNCPDAEPGQRYRQLAEESGGLAVSICAENFGTSLDALGFTAAGLRRQFALTQPAYPESVAVWIKTRCNAPKPPSEVCDITYNDCASSNDVYGHTCVLRQALPDGFAYETETGSIRFYGNAVPGFGAIIEVGYIPIEEIP